MGFRTIRTSDISGKAIHDDKVVTVVIRSEGKKFDCVIEELAELKRLTNVVEMELQHANGEEEDIIVTKADFDKLVTPEVLERADNIRGRRTGYKPKTNGD